jgi:hypothetical protein
MPEPYSPAELTGFIQIPILSEDEFEVVESRIKTET